MKITGSLKKRFLKDYSLPITITSEPYFSYFLEMYDPLYSSVSKYESFVKVLEKLGGEENFFKETTRITTSIIKDISDTVEFSDLNALTLVNKDCVPEKEFYNLDNAYKNYISFDLKKANFQALKWVSDALVLNCKTYEDLLGKYTQEVYFAESKHIRQIIFGHLNPKRQRTIQKYLIQNILLPKLLVNHAVSLFKTASPDEIIMENTLSDFEKMSFESSESYWDSQTGLCVNVGEFYLNTIGGRDFFVKEYRNQPLDFKAIPAHCLPECYRYYMKQPLGKYDLCTMMENRIVAFQEPLWNNHVK